MSERSILLLLGDIENAIAKILLYTKDYTLHDYKNNSKTKEAVERNFEIIGEAVSRLPTNYKLTHSSIEWRILKDFRNFIIHEYFGINDEIVWETIVHQLPELIKMLRVEISEMS